MLTLIIKLIYYKLTKYHKVPMQLIDNTDQTYCFDNEALYDICQRVLKVWSFMIFYQQVCGHFPFTFIKSK